MKKKLLNKNLLAQQKPSRNHRRYAQRHEPLLFKSPSPPPEINEAFSPTSESPASSPQPPSPSPEFSSSGFPTSSNFQPTLGFEPSSGMEPSPGFESLSVVQQSSENFQAQTNPLLNNLNYSLPRFTPHIFDSALGALQNHFDAVSSKTLPFQESLPNDKPKRKNEV